VTDPEPLHLQGGRSMAEDIKRMIIDYVKKEYLDEDSDQEITENTKLISGGIVDSFSMVSLKMFLEKKFQIKIPDEKATPEAFDSVNNIITLLQEFVRS
jgi:acyl carrier protein